MRCLTPDSSRFWPKSGYQVGVAQKSFDKQFVRDYLLALKWDQRPPAPVLPDDVVKRTSEKYLEVLSCWQVRRLVLDGPPANQYNRGVLSCCQ